MTFPTVANPIGKVAKPVSCAILTSSPNDLKPHPDTTTPITFAIKDVNGGVITNEQTLDFSVLILEPGHSYELRAQLGDEATGTTSALIQRTYRFYNETSEAHFGIPGTTATEFNGGATLPNSFGSTAAFALISPSVVTRVSLRYTTVETGTTGTRQNVGSFLTVFSFLGTTIARPTENG